MIQTYSNLSFTHFKVYQPSTHKAFLETRCLKSGALGFRLFNWLYHHYDRSAKYSCQIYSSLSISDEPDVPTLYWSFSNKSLLPKLVLLLTTAPKLLTSAFALLHTELSNLQNAASNTQLHTWQSINNMNQAANNNNCHCTKTLISIFSSIFRV